MVNKTPKLAIVCTHPIQYNAPAFRLLNNRGRIAIRVFYTWSQAQGTIYDPGFDHQRKWDIPLLDGYDHCFVENIAKDPGSHHFRGIVNPSLIHEVQTWQPEAILIFGWCFQSHLACMRHFKGKIPVFFRGDSTLLDEKNGLKTWLRRLFLNWVYRHVDKAFYAGKHNRTYFEAHGLKANKLIAASHAVDNERFSAGEAREAGEALRASLDINADDFLILFVGKFEEKKNPFYLLRLAQTIQDPKVKFLLVGKGPLEKGLKDMSKGNKRICFLPFQNQLAMPAVYRAADCFLLSSTGPGETWGLAANEAMACGLPVILSEKAGGAVDLVNGNGIIFHPSETGAVAAYIEKLSTHPELLAMAKQQSLKQIQKFRFENFAEALETELLAQKEGESKADGKRYKQQAV